MTEKQKPLRNKGLRVKGAIGGNAKGILEITPAKNLAVRDMIHDAERMDKLLAKCLPQGTLRHLASLMLRRQATELVVRIDR